MEPEAETETFRSVEARGASRLAGQAVFCRPWRTPLGSAVGFELAAGGCRVCRVVPAGAVVTESAAEVLALAWLTLEAMLGV